MEDLLLQTRTNDILKFPDELTNLTRGQRAEGSSVQATGQTCTGDRRSLGKQGLDKDRPVSKTQAESQDKSKAGRKDGNGGGTQ